MARICNDAWRTKARFHESGLVKRSTRARPPEHPAAFATADATSGLGRPRASTGNTHWAQGWWSAARRCDSPNHGPRPDKATVELLVIHSISLPAGQFGGDCVERLFTNQLDSAEHPSFEPLRDLRVSAHFFVRRDGELLQFVSCERRAWHAGESSWRGRANCNDWSIGIELEGLEVDSFEPVQYRTLTRLMKALRLRHPIGSVAGHEHVAPHRKHDPGSGFDWALLRAGLRWPRRMFPGDIAKPRR